MSIEEYLDTLTEQIRCKKAREPVREEILQHLQEQTEAFMAEGMDKTEAVEAAVREMGDPKETGRALDRVHRPKTDWRLIVLVGLLSAGGFLARALLERDLLGDAYGGFEKQLIALAFGIVVLTAVYFLDYSWFGRHAKGIFAAILLLLYAARFWNPRWINGSARWIDLGFGDLQADITGMLPVLVPLYGAVLHTYRGKGYRALAKGVLWMLPGIFLAFSCPSTYATALLYVSFCLVMTAAVSRGWFRVSAKRSLGILWGAALLLPAAGLALILGAGGYRAARLQAVLNPERFDGYGYTINMIRKLLGSSQLVGPGSLTGNDAVNAFAEAYLGEYTLTFLVSCYGVLAGLLFIGLLVLMIARIYRVASKQRSTLGMIMGVGCACVLALQVLFFVLENTGVFPLGAYSPFLSGNMSWTVAEFFLLGLVLSVYRYENILGRNLYKEKNYRA